MNRIVRNVGKFELHRLFHLFTLSTRLDPTIIGFDFHMIVGSTATEHDLLSRGAQCGVQRNDPHLGAVQFEKSQHHRGAFIEST